jgi:hypothetical protein
MNSSLREPDLQHIGQAILSGNKVEAIRRYRDLRPAGLAEAKRAVEEIEASMRAATPEAFAAGDARKVKEQKLFFVVFCCVAVFTAIGGVKSAMQMARGEMTSWFTLSMSWISTLCFIAAAISTGRSVWGSRGR